MRLRSGRARRPPWPTVLLAALVALLASTSASAAAVVPSPLSLRDLTGLCNDYGDILATADLTQAARVCLDQTLSPTTLCPACQCQLQTALQPMAALTVLVSMANGTKGAAPASPPPSQATLLQACMPTIARLWSQLYPPQRLTNATSALRKCTWGPEMTPEQCGAQLPAVNSTTRSEGTPATGPYALTAEGVTWGALCACNTPKSSRGALCDPNTLREYESECHAKCMGLTNTTALLPCTSLFNTTRTPRNLQTPTTAPLTPPTNTSTPQTPTPLVNASSVSTGLASSTNTTSVPAVNNTAVPAATVGPATDQLFYEYDYDAPVCATPSQCPPVGHGGAVVTAPVEPDLRTSVQQALRTQGATASAGNSTTPRVAYVRSGAGSNKTAGPSVQTPGPTHPCPKSTTLLLRALGPVLPAYMADCAVARCFLTTLAEAVGPAPTTTTTTSDPPSLTDCLPQLASTLFQSGGVSALDWLRTCAGSKQPSSPATSQGCSGVLPVAQLRAAIASVLTNATLAAAPPATTLPFAALSKALSGSVSISNVSIINGTMTSMGQSAVTVGNATPVAAAPAVNSALTRWLRLIRDPTAATASNTRAAAAAGAEGAAAQSPWLTVLDPNVILSNSSLWAFTAPPVGTNITRSPAVTDSVTKPSSGSSAGAVGVTRTALTMQQSLAQQVVNSTSVDAGSNDGWVQWQSTCACQQEYAPICRSTDLHWYPSACYAKCQGVSDKELGPCYFTDTTPTATPNNSGSNTDKSYEYYYTY